MRYLATFFFMAAILAVSCVFRLERVDRTISDTVLTRIRLNGWGVARPVPFRVRFASGQIRNGYVLPGWTTWVDGPCGGASVSVPGVFTRVPSGTGYLFLSGTVDDLVVTEDILSSEDADCANVRFAK